MSLSTIKQEILETLLLSGKPIKAMEITNELKKEFPPVMMHLLGLTRMGHVSSPQKGLYQITQKGKDTLGISETTKEKAAAILTYAPHDKAFNFYAELGKPLHIHAHSLRDFANKIGKVNTASLEFHMERGDFEAWFRGLGDEELAKKTALLKQKKVVREELRKRLNQIVEQRYFALSSLAGQPIPTE